VRKTNDLLKKALQRMVNAGVVLDPLNDLDDLIRLNELAYEVTNPDATCGIAALLNEPIILGNTKLYPMTLGAYLWIREKLLVWFDERDEIADLGIAYALAHAHDPEALTGIPNAAKARRRIMRWSRASTAPAAELAKALMTLTKADQVADHVEDAAQKDEDADEGLSSADCGPVIALLCREYENASPDYWIWEASFDWMNTCLLGYQAKRREEKQDLVQVHGGKTGIDTTDPVIQASERLRQACNKFRKRKLKEAQDDG